MGIELGQFIISFTAIISFTVTIIVWVGSLLFVVSNNRKEKNRLLKKYKELFKQKKSSEVRLGQITEQFAPFIPNWEHDPKNFKFLGAPIDGISFNLKDEEIVFVEIKSGKARLSENQKKIKEIIEKGNVVFKTFRVSDKYCGYIST